MFISNLWDFFYIYINAWSLRDEPAFYYISFGDVKRKGLHRLTLDLIKRDQSNRIEQKNNKF